MNSIHPSRLLQLILIADAIVSGAVAALQVAMPSMLADLLQLPSTLILCTGLFLIAYVVLLIAVARSNRTPAALVSLIIVGNVAWAIGCLALIGWPGLSPSGLGIGYLVLQSVTVLVFAIIQRAGLRRSTPASGRTVARAA